MVDVASKVTKSQTHKIMHQKFMWILFHSFLLDIGFGIGFPFFIGLFIRFFTPEELLLISASIIIVPLLIYLILGYFYYNESKKMSQSLLPPLHIDDFLKIFKRIKKVYYVCRTVFMSGAGVLSYFLIGIFYFAPFYPIATMFEPVTIFAFVGSLTTGGILSITSVKLWLDYKFGQLLSDEIQNSRMNTSPPIKVNLTHSITQNTLWIQQLILIGIFIGISTIIIVEFDEITPNIIISLLLFSLLFTGFLIIQFFLVFKPLSTIQRRMFALIEKDEPWEQMPIITMNEIGLITYNYNLAIQEIERALHAIEKRFKDLVNNVPIGLFRVNLDKLTFEVNPAVIQILGEKYTEKSALQEFYNRISNDPVVLREIGLLSESESQTRKIEMPIRREDDSELFVRMNVRVVPDSTGNIYYEGSLEDITEQKKMEAIRQELEEKRQLFISIINHEIRTPLTIIRGYNDLIQKYIERIDKKSRDEIFDTIKKHTERIEQLLMEVADFTQLQRGILQYEKEDFDFWSFIIEALKPYQHLLPGQFEFNDISNQEPIIIHGDKDRLQQALDNILNNAIENTSNEDRKIIVLSEIYNDYIKITISDNGAGIAQENLEKIFEQFQTFETKYSSKGTGIGLYLAKEIINAHDGKLIAESQGVDKGATFILELPRKL